MTRIVLLALALTACSEKEDLTELRSELTDLRAEQRVQREEVRELRDMVRKLSEPPATEPADSEPPAAEPPAAAAAPGAAATPAPPSPPAAAGKPVVGKAPTAQGSVNIQVESNPAGAAVFVAEKKVGLTPVIIKTPVGSDEIRVRLEKSGYRPRLMMLKPEEDTKISVQLAKKGE